MLDDFRLNCVLKYTFEFVLVGGMNQQYWNLAKNFALNKPNLSNNRANVLKISRMISFIVFPLRSLLLWAN
jgi:hypothetical protein